MRNIAPRPLPPQLAHNPPIPAALPEPLRQRLEREGVTTCEAWRALSRKERRSIWGITAAMADLVDQAVAEVLR